MRLMCKLRESVGAVEVVVVGRKCPIHQKTLQREHDQRQHSPAGSGDITRRLRLGRPSALW